MRGRDEHSPIRGGAQADGFERFTQTDTHFAATFDFPSDDPPRVLLKLGGCRPLSRLTAPISGLPNRLQLRKSPLRAKRA